MSWSGFRQQVRLSGPKSPSCSVATRHEVESWGTRGPRLSPCRPDLPRWLPGASAAVHSLQALVRRSPGTLPGQATACPKVWGNQGPSLSPSPQASLQALTLGGGRGYWEDEAICVEMKVSMTLWLEDSRWLWLGVESELWYSTRLLDDTTGTGDRQAGSQQRTCPPSPHPSLPVSSLGWPLHPQPPPTGLPSTSSCRGPAQSLC